MLFHDRYLLSPGLQVVIEHTVKYLKEYQAIVEDKQEGTSTEIDG